MPQNKSPIQPQGGKDLRTGKSLSNPRWHKRSSVIGKKNSPKPSKAESATQVQYDERLSRKRRKHERSQTYLK